MKYLVPIALVSATLLAAVAGMHYATSRSVHRERQSVPTRESAPAMPTMARSAWGETHDGFEIHAQIDADRPDAKLVSRAVAILPPKMRASGGVLHLLVTQPEYAVLDSVGKVYTGTDGVLLTATAPPLQELSRLFLNLHKNSEQRRWHSWDVTVPEGTSAILFEALAGLHLGDNNWNDRLWVSMREQLPLLNGMSYRPLEPTAVAVTGCRDTQHATGCAGRLKTGITR